MEAQFQCSRCRLVNAMTALHTRRLSVGVVKQVCMAAVILRRLDNHLRAGAAAANSRHSLPQSISLEVSAKDRDVIVWLPPGYQQTPPGVIPLLMHDGIMSSRTWRMDETALALISNKQIEPIFGPCWPRRGQLKIVSLFTHEQRSQG